MWWGKYLGTRRHVTEYHIRNIHRLGASRFNVHAFFVWQCETDTKIGRSRLTPQRSSSVGLEALLVPERTQVHTPEGYELSVATANHISLYCV